MIPSAFGIVNHPDGNDPDPNYRLQLATDSTGEYAYWEPQALGATNVPAVKGWTKNSSGIIRNGKPPKGEYVPLGVAGLNYVSPGYLSPSDIGTWIDPLG